MLALGGDLFSESFMGFISSLPAFKMQLMWAGVTSQPQQWEEIQRNGRGFPGGILCWEWASISPEVFSAFPEETEAAWLLPLCSESLPRHGKPEFAGCPQEQGAGLCARLERLRGMRRC